MTENKVNFFLNPANQGNSMQTKLKEVIKRDGSIEPFMPEKLNNWAKWSCKGSTASWSSLVLTAVKQISDSRVTTDFLQELLITTAMNLLDEDPAYDKVAVELMIAQLRKQLFDSYYPPHLKSFHDHMVDIGQWSNKAEWLSAEDFEYLNSIIDHERDHLFTSAGFKQFKDKYSRRSTITNEIFETPQFAYMGMVMEMLALPHWDLDDAEELYNALSLQKVNVPTPPLVGLRSGDRGFASCCLVDATDTLQSIDAAEHVVFNMVAARAGIGYHLESRSLADPVRNGTFPHSGKLPYYRHIDRSVKSNTQQSRGGSATVYYAFFDPEIIKMIQVKSQRSAQEDQIDKMDYNLKYNQLLFKRYVKKQDITLMSFFYAPEVWEAFHSGSYEEFERLYIAAEKRLENETKVGFKGERLPVAPKIPAADILEEWVTVRMETGRAYAMDITETNRNSRFSDPIRMSNLCVAPETKILTKNGNVKIIDLVGKEVEIWNGQEWSLVTPRKTGENQELIKITFSDGTIIESTPYHKFYHQPEYIREDRRKSFKQGLEEVRAINLQVGMKMPKFVSPTVEHGTKVLESPYINGFFTGDGTYGRNGEAKLYFYEKGGKLPLVGKIDANIQGTGTLDSAGRLNYIIKSEIKPKYFVPSSEYTIESRIKWLEGYLDADGCLQKNGNTPSIVVTSSEKDFLIEVKELLLELGISSKIISGRPEGYYLLPDGKGSSKQYHCRETSRLIIGSNGFWKLKDLGLTLSKEESLSLARPNRDATQFVTVTKVEATGRISDTYCFTEPKLNLGVFNGILAGNCVEIVQPTYPIRHVVDMYRKPEELDLMDPSEYGEVSLCNLGGIALGRIHSLEEWESISYILLKFVDSIIDIQDYPFPTLAYTAKKRRNVGIGLMNAAGAMAEVGLAYEGVEARNWIHREAEKASYFLHKASVRLAQEVGAADWFHRTRTSKGELLVDTYKKTVDDLVTVGLEMDWESLRSDILKYGMRNSVLMANMPGESSSVLLGVTNSVEPPRGPLTVKTSGVNKVVSLVPNINDWDIFVNYKYAFELDRTEHIKWIAVLQKFTCQSSSAQLYYDYNKYPKGIIPQAEVIKDLMNQTKYGIKTIYYANFDVDNGGAANSGCESGACQI